MSTQHERTHFLPDTALRQAAERACGRIAPLWPLRHFVAVNPYLGLTDRSFVDAAQRLAQAAGAATTMDRAFYATAIADGRITEDDLARALAADPLPSDGPQDAAGLKQAAFAPAVTNILARLSTFADLAGSGWSDYVTERVSHWAAAHFDEGQATWPSPWCDWPPYTAWRAQMSLDAGAEFIGLAGFRRIIAGLPDNAEEAFAVCLDRLGIGSEGAEPYLQRLLMSVGGWAGYARYKVWNKELRGESDTTLFEFLVVRLAWDAALHAALAGESDIGSAWAEAKKAFIMADAAEPPLDLRIDCVLQAAYERGWQRELAVQLSAAAESGGKEERPAVQAAFCIDVRSEVFRRALESVSGDVETIGFAGFFGFPIEYVPLGQSYGRAQCPVLLMPQATVCETVKGATREEETELLGLRLMRRRAGKAWKSFKLAAVSSFAFVETVGLGYIAKLAANALGLSRPVPHPDVDNIDERVAERLSPQLTVHEVAGRLTGLSHDDRVAMAEGALHGMGLTQNFARLVMIAGHGSSTVNNPHASGLDCGACGGDTGEANARVAAAVLNDAAVRAALAERGIKIPADTVFLAGLHDTTTDTVTLFDTESVPRTHRDGIDTLRRWLSQAGHRSRAQRAGLLNLDPDRATDRAVIARSRDWSEVRPEWGLAGCGTFIAAPRHRTRGCDLGGRAFLHNYDWRQDTGFAVLETIMTAPMIVASWISLQYYGSTVDNRVFGSGNKTLHNVTGTIGVLEGNGGDLRPGLPWQSVHDGARLIHEPLRLSVIIEAPTEAISEIIERHDDVRRLVDNGWLHLLAMDDRGMVAQRYCGGLEWRPQEVQARSLAA